MVFFFFFDKLFTKVYLFIFLNLEKKNMTPQNSNLKNSLLLTISSFINQIFIRLLSFILNAILINISTTKVIGIVNVKLNLLFQTILFIAREPNRTVNARNQTQNDESWFYFFVVGVLGVGFWKFTEENDSDGLGKDLTLCYLIMFDIE